MIHLGSISISFAQKSPHGSLSIPCTDCHTTDSWKELAQPMRFKHSITGFILEGQHATVACLQCHTTKQFTGTKSTCFSCHQKDFNRALTPNHQLGKLSRECLTCHTLNAWRPSIFQHAKTNFQLTGAHQSVDCASCHINNKFTGLPRDCFSCHQKDFTQTVTPNHNAAKFSHDCTICHSLNSWKPSTFDHSKTNFQLVGAHQRVECSSCHAAGKFRGILMECFSCHQKDFINTKTLNHVKGQFDHDCATCHTKTTWKPSTFDHNKTTFQLMGGHIATDCASCHTTGTFKGTSNDCFVCHQKDYTISKPNHVAGQFDHNCVTCHSMNEWKPATFDHKKTKYPLVGSHIIVECASCHANGKFQGAPTDCYSCHVKEYSGTKSPNHLTGKFDHDCSACHSINDWIPSTFDHAKTSFQLAGAHVAVSCMSCHSNGVFKGVSTDCYVCHQQKFVQTTNPNHVTAQFDHNCTMCHSLNAWKPATFDHAKTNFQLLGAHKTVECSSCHTNGVFKGVSTDCYVCHQQKFVQTTNPNHVTAQFDHNCITCHSLIAWKPATFDHNKTNFKLTGAHISTDCLFCHKNGQYKGTATDCYSCHTTDFARVTDPNHVSGNFDRNCISCHSTNAWKPATFDHSKTQFPLTGAHVQTQCSQCHVGGKYTGTTTDCYTCHKTDYTSAANPNHATAKYPTDCKSCHTTTGWKPSTFDHTPFFPIGASAKHRPGRWNLCSDCHTNPSNSKVFSCITCHEHNKADMDKEHQGKNGYLYESNACYKCHPQGRG